MFQMEGDDNRSEAGSSRDGIKRDKFQHQTAFGVEDRPFRRNGPRPQTSQSFERQHATSPVTMQSETTPRLQRRPTQKRSLMNLFSRAKVDAPPPIPEQEISLPILPPPPAHPTLRPSKSNAFIDARPLSPTQEEMPRRPSFPNNAPTAPSSFQTRGPPVSALRSIANWDAPPLFQAYPQATKAGLLELPDPSKPIPQSKNRKISMQTTPTDQRSRNSTEDTRSIETRRTAKTTLSRNKNNGVYGHVELPRKIFVLIQSGYLLQYSESGPSERLPEKILQVGAESAVFVSDLIPGKYHVIQVFQAVADNGTPISNSGSIFSRLGKRSLAAKRMTSSFLLIMPNGDEMKAWLTAFRENIESLGGARARQADHVAGIKKAEVAPIQTDLRPSPAQSRELLTLNNSSKAVSPIVPDSTDVSSIDNSGVDEDSRSQADTIDDIDQMAADLNKTRQQSDLYSTNSTATGSMDHHGQNSVRDSQRLSAATLATTAGTPVTTSLSGSPLWKDELKAFDTPTDIKLMSQEAMLRRQSMKQMLLAKEQSMPRSDIMAQAHANGRTSTSPMKNNAPRPYLLTAPVRTSFLGAASSPDLRALAEARAKHDSKMPSSPMVLKEDGEPLDAIMANLPPLAHAKSDQSLNMSQFPVPPAGAHTSPQRQNSQHMSREVRASRRQSRLGMTLRINPSLPNTQPAARTPVRDSRLFEEDSTVAHEPAVHTLTAQIDGTNDSPPRPEASSEAQSTHDSSPTTDTTIEPSARSSVQSSVRSFSVRPAYQPTTFSSPLPSPLILSSPMGTNSYGFGDAAPQPSPVTTQPKAVGAPLRRPNSIRISSGNAAFLSSMRSPPTGTPGQPPSARNSAAYNRGYRLSRSSANLPSPAPSASSLDPFSLATPLETPGQMEDVVYHPTPPLDRNTSPLPSLSFQTPRTPGRRNRSKGQLPELDLGIPVVGLGPPAPPPSAPLPLPPSRSAGSQSSSPMPSPAMSVPTGLGIRI